MASTSPPVLPPADAVYEHRPKPFSHPLTLQLRGAILHAERGSRQESYPLAKLEMIRLAYRPANTARLGFSCYIRLEDGRSLTFTNLDWRSMVENHRQDAEYAAFVQKLVQRAARANPKLALRGGVAGWRRALFGLGVALIGPGLLVAALYFLRNGSWPMAVLTLAISLWMGFYAYEFLRRNRPRVFAPGAIPPEVMPPA